MPYVTNKGVNIHYEVEGDGPPLVMLIGLLASVELFYEFDYVAKLKEVCQLILI